MAKILIPQILRQTPKSLIMTFSQVLDQFDRKEAEHQARQVIRHSRLMITFIDVERDETIMVVAVADSR